MSVAGAPASHTVVEALRERFPDAVLADSIAVDTPTVSLKPETVGEVARYIRHELGFHHPVLCTAVDFKDSFEVVWHVGNLKTNQLIAFKTRLTDREDPHVEALTLVWPGMDWHEREAYDLMGILFDGHPDLRRILLPDDWVGHPLRKDYTAID